MKQPNQLKKPVEEALDWHWADVLATLRKRGWSLRQVGLAAGYKNGNTLGIVARLPYPKAEAILARYLDIAHPQLIWPSRYAQDGQPNRRVGRAPMRGQPPAKATTRHGRRNPQKRPRQ